MPEPLVLINPFSMPLHIVDGFVSRWEENTDTIRNAPGFGGTLLHRAIDPAAAFPLVNIATWESEEAWRAATARPFTPPRHPADTPRQGVTPFPALYRIVSH